MFEVKVLSAGFVIDVCLFSNEQSAVDFAGRQQDEGFKVRIDWMPLGGRKF